MDLLPKNIFDLGIKIQFLKNAAINRYNVVYEDRTLVKDDIHSVLGLLFSLKKDLKKHGICESEIGSLIYLAKKFKDLIQYNSPNCILEYY